LVASLGRTDRTVIVDAGRLGGSPVLAAFRGSPAQWLVVVRNDPGELTVAAAGLRSLDADLGVRLVMIGSGPHPAGEVEAVLGAPVAAVLPVDAAAADAVGAGRPHRDLRSTPWARAVRSLAASLLAADIRGAAAGVA
jgi:hypothetical protein